MNFNLVPLTSNLQKCALLLFQVAKVHDTLCKSICIEVENSIDNSFFFIALLFYCSVLFFFFCFSFFFLTNP
jgi:hypothetical protein